MDSEAAVKLQTLLNVSAALPKSKKRQRQDWAALASKARKVVSAEPAKVATVAIAERDTAAAEQSAEPQAAAETEEDAFKLHFGAESALISPSTLEAAQSRAWTAVEASASTELGKLHALRLDVPTATAMETPPNAMNARLSDKFNAYKDGLPTGNKALCSETYDYLSSYRDLLCSRVELHQHEPVRAALAAHAMNHIIKTRNRILRNNEALAKGDSTEDRETRDQGYTRPKVLILLPFRNSALAWLDHLTTLSLASTVENRQRFTDEFSLPSGTIDKLSQSDAVDKYPADHIATFHGNIDDSFRSSIKLTSSLLHLFGLRMSIEKQRKGAEGGAADFLSSIELLVVDQADVMGMQNWEHLQFVMKYLNQLPKEAHDADFARIKPWYLDGQAQYLRQSVILSAYETPEIRSLFSKNMLNLAGKARTEGHYPGVLQRVPRGVKQVFTRFEAGASALAESEARFEYFKTKTLPTLLKSAVASSGNTMIFVPSYFDFLRVQAYMDEDDQIDFEGISEYSSNSDIARARNAFLAGNYRIRGAHNIIYYALPEHAAFYEEFMTQPFQHVPGNKYDMPDESEVSAFALFSKLDAMRLERIVGSQAAARMLSVEETKFTFQ